MLEGNGCHYGQIMLCRNGVVSEWCFVGMVLCHVMINCVKLLMVATSDCSIRVNCYNATKSTVGEYSDVSVSIHTHTFKGLNGLLYAGFCLIYIFQYIEIRTSPTLAAPLPILGGSGTVRLGPCFPQTCLYHLLVLFFLICSAIFIVVTFILSGL